MKIEPKIEPKNNGAYLKLQKYQRGVFHDVLRKFNGRALLALDMGLGKSAISIAVLEHINECSLIACPASLKYNWLGEIRKFNPALLRETYICEGRRPIDSGIEYKCYICNYEILPYWQDFFRGRIKAMVLDESHFVKERSAKRTKAAIFLSLFVKYKILLTGTPIENKPVELWSQLAIINKGFFPSWLLFAKKYNGAVKDVWGWRMTRATNTRELNKFLLENCMIRLRKEDVLKDLPPVSRHVIPIPIDNAKEYDSAENDIIAWIAKNSGLDIAKAKKAEALLRLDKLKLIAAKGKLAMIKEWVNENSQNMKLVVFCYHREILELLHKGIANHVFVPSELDAKGRQEAVSRFQDDDGCRVFLTTIRVGGTGFTLTASHTTVFTQLDWNPSKHGQAEARVHRIGQKADSVDAVYFIAKDTIEEKIINLIDTKAAETKAVIDGSAVEAEDLLGRLLKEMKNGKGRIEI